MPGQVDTVGTVKLAKYWTIAELKRGQFNEWRLSRPSRRRYRQSESRLTGTVRVALQALNHVLTASGSEEYLVLVNYTGAEARRAAEEARNAILARLTDRLQALFPLSWYLILPSMLLKGDSEPVQLPSDAFISLWVDGREFDQEANCRSCPKSPGRPLLVCQPFRGSCDNFPKPFLPVKLAKDELWRHTKVVVFWQDPPEEADYLASCDWLKDHSLRKSISGDYKELKQACLRHAFESPDLSDIATTDSELAEAESQRARLSALAGEGAQTRRYRKQICGVCLHAQYGTACARNGGSYCKGPYHPDDYRSTADAAEPWAVHAVLLSGRAVNTRGACPKFKHAHRPPRIVGPAADRYIDGVRLRRDKIRCEFADLPYGEVCKLLGIAPVTSWQELSGTPEFKYYAPSVEEYEQLRALSTIMRASNLTVRGSSGFCTTGELIEVQPKASYGERGLTLAFSSVSGTLYHKRVVGWADLFRFRRPVLRSVRDRENEAVKGLTLQMEQKYNCEQVRKAMQMANNSTSRLEVAPELGEVLAQERRLEERKKAEEEGKA